MKGKFPKNLSPTYNECSILKDYMTDMSLLKDGGGTQYTFLEAIHHDGTLLILHNVDKCWNNI